MLTTIPFSGFYESHHSGEIDRTLEMMLSDSSGCSPASERISEEIWGHVSTPMVAYTKAFVESFQAMLKDKAELDIPITWESVQSPREYNFGTDRLFATVSLKSVRAMMRKVDKAVLDRVAKERFTSSDGFISHYSADVKSWGSVINWDHNQVGTLVAALVVQFFGDDWEWNITEDWNSNGDLDNWVYAALDDEGKRLVKLADYLRSREERQYRKIS